MPTVIYDARNREEPYISNRRDIGRIASSRETPLGFSFSKSRVVTVAGQEKVVNSGASPVTFYHGRNEVSEAQLAALKEHPDFDYYNKKGILSIPGTPKVEPPPPKPTTHNINEADKEQLIAMPGIGEKTAEKILELKPFEDFEDLEAVLPATISDSAREELRLTVTF